MPIYEYECAKCKHRMEALRKISDEPLLECPECGKPSLTKLVSASSFRLKGGGWYETDFKTGNKKQLADSDSAAPSGDTASKSSSEQPSASSKSSKSATKDSASSPAKTTKKAAANNSSS